jgi:hypothetical protein
MRRKYLVPICLVTTVLFCFLLTIPTSATTTLSQSFTANTNLAIGSIVSLKNNTADQVVPAENSNVDGLLGVVIDAGNSLLSLSNGEVNQVQVATSGTLQALVSTINGDIKRGDHITASPIYGVGMKATSNVRIIGLAQGDLNDSNGVKQTYTDSVGKKHTVTMGQVPLLVNVSYYFKEPDKTLVPSALQNVANALAGKSVSTLPIIISAAIFIITMIIVVSIIFTMIRSSIISVGRNPMSQAAIYRDLIQLSALVLAILAVGMVAIYLVLTRM